MGDNKIKRLLKWLMHRPTRAMLLLYCAGIVWHCLHPMVSVLTGHFDNPRRWYIDENSLDPNGLQLFGSYDLILQTKSKELRREHSAKNINSMCDGLSKFNIEIPCHQHSSFEIAKISPYSAAVVPGSEAIVVVVPQFVPFTFALAKKRGRSDDPDKSRPQLQASLLQFIQRLSTPQTSPWLAKTILIVAARHPELPGTFSDSSQRMQQTVSSFLDVYLGGQEFERSSTNQQLPTVFSGALIRNLVVLDLQLLERDTRPLPKSKEELESYEPVTGELRILPQGRRGVLPNMDMVFAIRSVYERSRMMQAQYPLQGTSRKAFKMNHLVVHPFRKATLGWWKRVKETLPEELHEWSGKMLHFLSFEYLMAFGPHPPHAPALDRGIDALTVQGVFLSSNDIDDRDVAANRRTHKLSPQEYPLEMIHRLELVVRCLSNLHERLHHSTSLYLLPTPDRFIKHEEYLVPNLLLIIPLLIRAVAIVMDTDKTLQPNVFAAAQAIGLAVLWTLLCSVLIDHGTTHLDLGIPGLQNADLLAAYLVALVTLPSLVPSWSNRKFTSTINTRKTIQLAACIVAACMHVCIAFGHVSLAFPSALIWTPLLAFAPITDSPTAAVPRQVAFGLLKACLFALSCPFTFVVPFVFQGYTPYIRYICIPLHMLFSILFILPFGK